MSACMRTHHSPLKKMPVKYSDDGRSLNDSRTCAHSLLYSIIMYFLVLFVHGIVTLWLVMTHADRNGKC
jgi:hypothetical protein